MTPLELLLDRFFACVCEIVASVYNMVLFQQSYGYTFCFRKRQSEEEQKETATAKKQKEWNEKWEVIQTSLIFTSDLFFFERMSSFFLNK